MKSTDIWKVSFTELLEIFQGALVSIIPWIDKAHIPWKEGSSYDDWDEISNALFKNIVVRAIEYSNHEVDRFAQYDMSYKDYRDLNMIIVEHPMLQKGIGAFVSLTTTSLPWDSVKIRMFDEKTFLTTETIVLSFKEATFFYGEHTEEKLKKLDSISVEL